jgi:protein-tyrosine-phosphatase
MHMPHVLFICTANICRSPVAEGVFRQRLEAAGLEGWTTGSAGTWAMQKRGASRNSVLVMEEDGIDIGDHQARLVSAELLDEADLVLCMESGHAEALRSEFPNVAAKIFMLSEMVGRRFSVSDPYGGSLPEYRRMADDVTEIIDEGFERIVALARG